MNRRKFFGAIAAGAAAFALRTKFAPAELSLAKPALEVVESLPVMRFFDAAGNLMCEMFVTADAAASKGQIKLNGQGQVLMSGTASRFEIESEGGFMRGNVGDSESGADIRLTSNKLITGDLLSLL